MKNLTKRLSLSAAVVLLGILTMTVVGAVFYVKNSAVKKQPEVSGLNVPKIEEEEFEGDVEARENWFMQQRLYGLGVIPVEARKNAKETADRIAPPLAENFAPASTWTLIGPQPTFSLVDQQAFGDSSGRVNAIVAQPGVPNTVLLGTATGGVWRSTNALAAVPVFTPVSDSQVDLAVGSIAFAQTNPINQTVVYAGMGDRDSAYLGTGVLRSANAGLSWTRVDTTGLPPKGTATQIAVALDNPNTVFVSRVEYFSGRADQVEGGFYRSTDGGVTWARTFIGSVSNIAQHPANPNVIYIAVNQTQTEQFPPVRGIYMSVDGGQTFNPISGGVDFSNYDVLLVATTAADSQKIYAFGGTTANPFVLGAVNNGTNVSNWTANPLPINQFDSGQFGYNTYLAADPFVDGRLYIGSRDVFRANLNAANNSLMSVQDVTNSWLFNAMTNSWDYTLDGAKAHSDQQSFGFAGDSNTFFIGSDGGINRTTDTGAMFTKNINQTLGLSQAIGITIHPTNPNIAYSGTQDNGTQRRETGTQWKEFSNGDGGYAVINPLDTSMVFTAYVNGSFSRYTNNGIDYSAQINANFGAMRTNFYMPFVGNVIGTAPNRTLYLYTGTQTLAVCADCATSAGQGTWTFPAGNASDLTRDSSDILNAVAVQKEASTTNTQVIYVGSNKGAFQVSQDGGATFTNRTTEMDNAVGSPGGRTITNIRLDPLNAGTAYITISGFGTMHVFRSTNFGANIAALPFAVDIPVNDFLIDPLVPTTFYLATDIGIYQSTDSGATWNGFNAGLPPVVVTRFDSAPNGRIAAATYGRSIYQLSSPTAASVSIGGRVFVGKGRGLANATVNLTDGNGTIRTTRTNPFGYYRFSEVGAGQTVILSVVSKRYQFAPQVISVTEELDELNFFNQP